MCCNVAFSIINLITYARYWYYDVEYTYPMYRYTVQYKDEVHYATLEFIEERK